LLPSSWHPRAKVTIGAPERGEKSNPADTRTKIIVETVNSPKVSVEEVPFDAIYSPQPAATTTATATAQLDGDDDDATAQFIPPQIRTRSEPTSARHFAEVDGLMGSEASAPNLFGGRYGSWTDFRE
jgi:hypothetical protein